MIRAFVDIVEREARPGLVVAEIGVWAGDTTIGYLPIVQRCDGLAYAVDDWCGNPTATGPIWAPESAQKAFEAFMARVAPYGKHVKVLRGQSCDMVPRIPDGSLDVCFIDADHRYEYAAWDIDLCLPKVKKGGLLCGHDLDTFDGVGSYTKEQLESDFDLRYGHCGVNQAVHDRFGTDVERPGDTVWAKRIA